MPERLTQIPQGIFSILRGNPETNHTLITPSVEIAYGNDVLVHYSDPYKPDDIQDEYGETDLGSWHKSVEELARVVDNARRENKLFVYVSSVSALSGVPDNDGLYNEQPPGRIDLESISWNAVIRRMAEQVVIDGSNKYAIVRVGQFIGDPNNPNDITLEIYNKIVNREGRFITNQPITPTDPCDLKKALEKIVERKLQGFFHVGSSSTTEIDIAKKISKEIGINHIIGVTVEEYNRSKDALAPRYPYRGLSTEYTQERLSLKFTPWQESVDQFLSHFDHQLSLVYSS